ncbi:MAG: REP-associated tyrosine transposase [Alphaproteobacteria bacterium]
MSRPLRLEYSGAIYHLTARGNARQEIFLDNADRKLFLDCLAEVVARFGWLCHAYCLMDNHYHLLVETPGANLSHGMRQLNGVYTQRFNRRHQRAGHVFQGRYKAIVVERDSHLLELCRYVVLNPRRAGMVRNVARYKWSSYPATIGAAPCPEWLSTDWLLAQFARRPPVARKRYADFVAQGVAHPSPWTGLRAQVLLGTERFVEKMRPLLEDAHAGTKLPRTQRRPSRPSLKALFAGRARKDKIPRDAAIRKALEHGYTMASIAAHAGLHHSTVSKIIKGVR